MTSPADQEPRATGRAVAVLVVVLCVLLGVVVGVVGGYTASKLAEPDPLGPTALPALPPQVPTGADVYLTGLTVGSLTEGFLRRAKWTCTTKATTKDQNPLSTHHTTCEPPEYGKLSVMLWHDGETKVKAVRATCRYPLGTGLCRTLARSIAEFAVVGQPDVAKRTAAWAAENVDRDATTVIGDVRLVSDISLRYPSMRIVPAE